MSLNNELLRSQNLEALNAAHPGLAEILRSAGPCTDADFRVDTERGVVSLLVSGTYVHSARNPVREAERLTRDLTQTKGLRVVVFYGFGLGYQIEATLETCPDLHCIIYEPDTPLLYETLRWRDLRHILGSERVSLFTACPPEHVAMPLRALQRSQVYAFRMRPLYARNTDAFEALDRVIQETFRRRDVNRATLKRFGRRWVVNLLSNLDTLAQARQVASLENLFPDIPAIVLAGGPGLDEVLPVLPRIAERCVVIAVDTSLVAALRHGVDPDFTIVVDPQYWNTRHLDSCQSSRSILVSESSTHPRVFRLLETGTYMCSSLFPLGRYIEQHLGSFGTLGAGGSVSTTAWDFARQIGAPDIFCGGLDLGFPGRNTHFHGSFFEERSLAWSHRFHTTESMGWRYLNSGTPFYARDYDGNPVLTDERMRVYHWWFENQMSQYPDTRTWNLNARAVAIPGMQHSAVQDILARDVRRPQIQSILDSLHEGRSDNEETSRRAVITEQLRRLNTQLETLADLCRQALEELSKPEPDTAILDRIDSAILEIDARDVAAFLVQHAVEDASLDPDLHPFEKSRRIYTSMQDSVLNHTAFLAQENRS